MRIRVFISGRVLGVTPPAELELPERAALGEALARLREWTAADLPPATLVAVSGRHLGSLAAHEPCLLREGDELALIAPVAGG